MTSGTDDHVRRVNTSPRLLGHRAAEFRHAPAELALSGGRVPDRADSADAFPFVYVARHRARLVTVCASHEVRHVDTEPGGFQDYAALRRYQFPEPAFSGCRVLACACTADPFPASDISRARPALMTFRAEDPVRGVFSEPGRFKNHSAASGNLLAEAVPGELAVPVHVRGLA
jgi:hypothetical protein